MRSLAHLDLTTGWLMNCYQVKVEIDTECSIVIPMTMTSSYTKNLWIFLQTCNEKLITFIEDLNIWSSDRLTKPKILHVALILRYSCQATNQGTASMACVSAQNGLKYAWSLSYGWTMHCTKTIYGVVLEILAK